MLHATKVFHEKQILFLEFFTIFYGIHTENISLWHVFQHIYMQLWEKSMKLLQFDEKLLKTKQRKNNMV